MRSVTTTIATTAKIDPYYYPSMFSNAFGYLSRPLVFLADVQAEKHSDVDVFVVGIPFDLGTTGRSGCRSGPTAIRRASTNMRWEQCKWPHRYNIFEELKVVDCGDLDIGPGESQETIEEIEEVVTNLLSLPEPPSKHQVRTLCFGGDHLVALPLIRTYSKKYGELAMVHFDAHTDTYKPEKGMSLYDHGSMFFRERMEGVLKFDQSVQVGIRTEFDYDDHPYTVIDTNMVHAHTPAEIAEQIRAVVTKNGEQLDQPVYVTFDIDCLDPSCAPGTGTPVCGGLQTQRALEIVRNLKGLNIIGADVVEVNEYLDHAQVTALAGATIGFEFLYLFNEAKRLFGPKTE